MTRNVTCWSNQETELGFGNLANNGGASTRGICLWISPKVGHMITKAGSSGCSRGQWIWLGGCLGGDLAILNVYAPIEMRARCVLWESLLETLPNNCRWLLCGNWNFVEQVVNKLNINKRIILVGEKRIFFLLIDALEVEDKFPIGSRIRFSWDNKRQRTDRHLARIDRFYTFKMVGARIDIVSKYYIRGDSTHSDHLPVLCTMTLQLIIRRRSPFQMNASYLKEPKVKAQVERIWGLRRGAGFSNKLRQVIKWYRYY